MGDACSDVPRCGDDVARPVEIHKERACRIGFANVQVRYARRMNDDLRLDFAENRAKLIRACDVGILMAKGYDRVPRPKGLD